MVANRYQRPDGYIECRRCRDEALRRNRARHPLTFALITSKAAEFWKLVKRASGDACWLWLGTTTKHGYGVFCLGSQSIRANRMVLALKLKRLPKGFACHTCGNDMCCRRSHIYEGTAASNAADRDRHGTTARGARHGSRTKPDRVPRGERNGKAKLSTIEVTSIRSLYATGEWTQVDLGLRFDVSQAQIGNIVRGKSRVDG